MRRIGDFVLGALLGFVIAIPVLATAAQSTARWESEVCATDRCLAEILNRLPADRAHDAKMTTWHNVTYVWYRK